MAIIIMERMQNLIVQWDRKNQLLNFIVTHKGLMMQNTPY